MLYNTDELKLNADLFLGNKETYANHDYTHQIVKSMKSIYARIF